MMTRKERYSFVIDYFSSAMPEAETELSYTNPFELLVAVILSAQCTDKRVNMITPALFENFPDVHALAAASPDVIFPFIKSISYPNNKAKHLSAMAKMIISDFKGDVPHTREDLEKLPGVGRKTANVIASVIYNIPAMPVDTHVFRVAARIGLTIGARSPLESEKQLIKFLPEEKLGSAHHWLILHGRYICTARNPKCMQCGIRSACKYFQKNKRVLMGDAVI